MEKPPKSRPPLIQGRVLDESSPEAQALLAEFNLETMRPKKFDPLFAKPPPAPKPPDPPKAK